MSNSVSAIFSQQGSPDNTTFTPRKKNVWPEDGTNDYILARIIVKPDSEFNWGKKDQTTGKRKGVPAVTIAFEWQLLKDARVTAGLSSVPFSFIGNYYDVPKQPLDTLPEVQGEKAQTIARIGIDNLVSILSPLVKRQVTTKQDIGLAVDELTKLIEAKTAIVARVRVESRTNKLNPKYVDRNEYVLERIA